MNILQIEDTLKGTPDEVLMQEAQAPTGKAPPYLVISEIQRRTDMRNRYAAEQSQPEPTVRDQIINQSMGGLGQNQPVPDPMMAANQLPPDPMMAANQPQVMPGGGMPPGAMMPPPGAMMPPPGAMMPPTQMMYDGGIVGFDEEDASIRLMNELIGFRNRIPDSGELYPSRADPIAEASVYGESIPSAILEDARKFNPEQSIGMTAEDLSVIQSSGVDLPEVLSYAGGGIVELQEGRQVPEEEGQGGYFSGDQGWIPDWIEENPGKTAIAAADAAALGLMFAPEPFFTKLGAGALKLGTTAARFIPRLFGARRLSNLPRAEQVARLGRHGYVGRAERLKAGTAVDRELRASALARVQTRLGLRGTAGLGILGATNLLAFGGDDDQTGGIEQLTDQERWDQMESRRQAADVGAGAGAGAKLEIGTDEWIREQLAERWRDKDSDRSKAVQEILTEQEERADLMERQSKSDILTSILMNLGAGTMSGDPGEGMRLAAEAVDKIRAASGKDIREQIRVTEELKLEGIDTEKAEEAALLASMLEMNKLQAQADRDQNADLSNALALIDSQVNAMAAASVERGEVMTKAEILGIQSRAYRAAGIKYGYEDILSSLTSFAPGSDLLVEEIN